MSNIEWFRVGAPQTDGYDATIIEALESDRWGWSKRPPTTDVTLCHGTVAVYPGWSPALLTDGGYTFETKPVSGRGALAKNNYTDTKRYLSGEELRAKLNAEWAATLEPHLTTWSLGATNLASFLDELWGHWTFDMTSSGSTSHHQSLDDTLAYPTHAIMVTGQDPHGCSQGIYHEYGHLRLESFGIGLTKHDNRLLANSPNQLFTSPVRVDKPRPMSAVLHAVYSWLFFTENDYQCAVSGLLTPQAYREYSAHNLPKIANGLATIRAGARWTPEGAQFIAGVMQWGDDLLARGYAQLAKA